MLLFICFVGIITIVVVFFHYFAFGSILGLSMYPALSGFETVLIKKKFKLEVGKVYIFKLDNEEFHFVKRLSKISDEGLYFLGDNVVCSYDSRDFGYVDPSTVKGEVLKLKFWRKF